MIDEAKVRAKYETAVAGWAATFAPGASTALRSIAFFEAGTLANVLEIETSRWTADLDDARALALDGFGH